MKKKLTIVVVILLVIVVATISHHTYAMYRSKSTGTATISTATFSVEAISNTTSINVTAGSTEAAYALTVKNNSEVNVTYTIQITNLPSGMKVKLDSGSYVTESSGTITFSNVGDLMVGGTTTKNHTLTFTTPLSSSAVSAQQANINVEFKQKLS